MFFQDVVDRVECPNCGAAKRVLCEWDEPPARTQTAILSHPERLEAFRVSMTTEEFASLGTDMLRKSRDREDQESSS